MKVYKGEPNPILAFKESFSYQGMPLLRLLGLPYSMAIGFQEPNPKRLRPKCMTFYDPALKITLPHFCHTFK